MSNEAILDELRYISKLLSELPQAIYDEMENRELIKQQQIIKNYQSDLNFHPENIYNINKMRYGYTEHKMDIDNEGI